MFGDGVYEVVPVYYGKAFTLERHLKRLGNSLREIRLTNPMSDAEWTALIEEAIERSGEQTAYLYLQVTRGVAPVRTHVYPEVAEPTVLVMVYEAPILERNVIEPLRMITLEDYRWERGHIKTVSLIAAGLLKNEAIARDADDAILVRNGFVTESTAANIFVGLNGKLVTPPRSECLLHGITRDVVLELADAEGIPCEEREIAESELASADEIMITSSGHETWPVGELNGSVVGNGAGGVLWQQIDRAFQAFKAREAGL